MQFLLYLTPQSQEIYRLISQRIMVRENTPVCRKYEIYGWVETKQPLLSICTNAIIAGGQPQRFINETLLHEATHVAQTCKGGFRGVTAFGMQRAKMALTTRRAADLQVATRLSKGAVQQEHEAFFLEDKPERVKQVVLKYCF
jgi:hypothetical protein